METGGPDGQQPFSKTAHSMPLIPLPLSGDEWPRFVGHAANILLQLDQHMSRAECLQLLSHAIWEATIVADTCLEEDYNEIQRELKQGH